MNAAQLMAATCLVTSSTAWRSEANYAVEGHELSQIQYARRKARSVIYHFNDCEIDTRLFQLVRHGVVQRLEPKAYDILLYLLQHADRVVPKRELLDVLWPDCTVTESSLSHYIMAARRAIGDDGREQCAIKTLHRRGYRFVAQLRREVAVPRLGSG